MKFCENCGSPVNGRFCPSCGASISGEPNPNTESYYRPTQSNGMAIAGFVLAFLFALLGLIFSIIGLNKAKELNGSGQGLATAGIIISIINMVLGFILYL